MPQNKKTLKFLVQEAQKFLPRNAPNGLKTMLQTLAESISSEDLEFFDPEILSAMASSHWEMAKKKGKRTPKLSIYCPHFEKGECRKTVIDIVCDDLAFLVDSVAAEVNKHNLLIGILIHPSLHVEYDAKGVLKTISKKKTDKSQQQSHLHIQINETLSEQAIKDLQDGLHCVLQDVLRSNKDWKPMLGKLKDASKELDKAVTRKPREEIEEYCAFLDYLHDNNFTLLGYREYRFVERGETLYSRTVKDSSLGLLQDDMEPAYITEREEGLPRNLQELRRKLPPVSVSKTNRLATVHRRVPMDCVAVKIYDENGKVIGEKLFLGLLTSVTYSRSVNDVPYLSAKVEETMKLSGYQKGSHDSKALRHILEKYPRDELFQIDTQDLLETAQDIIRLQERQRIALFMRKDPFGRYLSCLVYIPRDRFGTKLRKNISKILEEETNGVCTNFYTTLDDSVFARVMFVISVSQKNPPRINTKYIEQRLRDAGKTWPERLSEALARVHDSDIKVAEIVEQYGEAFPVSYTTRYHAKQSVFDIGHIEQALESGRIVLDLYRPSDLDLKKIRLKIFHVGSPIILSDVLPILENMGLTVIAELPYEVKPEGAEQSVWIHDFLLETSEIEDFVVIGDIKESFEEAFSKIWDQDVDNDRLNRLILSANATWRETMILRSYARYVKQLRLSFSRLYVEQVLTENPKISRVLIELFDGYHNPKTEKQSEGLVKKALNKLEKEFEKVESSEHDRVLRKVLELIKATLRTNFYQKNSDGSYKTAIAFKFDCSQISDMPAPKPYREIFVYSRRVEAVHLRGGEIARGGLRWSDRHEDYRTEVLGLMKAQMVKNTVIIPMGSKGGFVIKTPTHSREEFQTEGIACYKIFIGSLLDVTDNRVGDKIVPPKDVVCRDAPDPYLVVAADKGTATFSDIANGISLERGFWLGDAFASGGSAGYDHKKMGITARGAWESVKYHFRLLNHDTQTQPFDVVGVGDMGGDVFGNGMLLSEQIRLCGAFNHLHIFCDPDPDPAASFKERQRLFKAVKGWGQYDQSKLSKGGAIFNRSDKTVTLTPEIKKRFDIHEDKVSPNELIIAMLKARTDLLWFGGIGTYIKSSDETDAQVGDKSNDHIRVNGSDIRAKVIAEGANLGVTQRGRIELALNGVNLNTDFLDNSAGVDSSDHEVNIKILFGDVMSQSKHKMDIKARNALLEKMTDEVAEHCLRNNYQQTQAISLMELQAPETLKLHDEFIQDLEREGILQRDIEYLPDHDEIAERMRIGKGLTRPEMCVMFAYAKIALTSELLNSDIPDNPKMHSWLLDYFPDILANKYHTEILRHRLSREIIATMMANSLINRMGPTFIKTLMNKTGARVDQVVQAYIVVRDAYQLRDMWDGIEALDGKVPAQIQLKAMKEIAQLSEHGITWFLTRLGRDINIEKDSKTFGSKIQELSKSLSSLLTNDLKENIKQRQDRTKRDGLPSGLSKQVAQIPVLSSACDIIRISIDQKVDLKDAARTYFELGERFHMDWLRQKVRFLSKEDHWENDAANGILDQLYRCQAGLAARILKDLKGKKIDSKTSLVEKWFEDNQSSTRQLDQLFSELRHAGTVDLTMLVVVEQRLRTLYQG